MKINIEFLGLPNITKAIGTKQTQFEISNGTTQNLLNELIKTYGQPIKQALYTDKDQLDNTIQILRNGKKWITHDKLDTKLKNGDKITFMMMVAGG